MRFKVGDRVLYSAWSYNSEPASIECEVIFSSAFTELYRIRHSGIEYIAGEYELEAIPKTVKRSYLKSPFS